MSLFSFILASARHYWRGHLGLLFGAFLASAILSGSLLVGDSVRASLRRVAEFRLGKVQTGLLGGDRWFTETLAREAGAAPLILAIGSASAGDVRVNGAQVLGVESGFWQLGPSGRGPELASGQVGLSESLARKLGAKTGDSVLVRLERPSAISRDAPLSGSTNEEVTLRREVGAIVGAEDFGTFQPVASQIAPDSVFVPLADLQLQIEMEGRVNALLSAAPDASALAAKLEAGKTLADLSLKLASIDKPTPAWELSTDRVFLDEAVAQDLLSARPGAYGVLTYLVNGVKSAKGATPYSMITAVDATAAGLPGAGEGILISGWLAEDQKLQIGDELEIRYYVVGNGRELREQTAKFPVRGILPMDNAAITPAWTPPFPGVSDVDNCRDWDPGFPMDNKAIRDQDEKYWDDYKGTPKGFIALADGQRLWGNRFGQLTAVRFTAAGADAAVLAKDIADRLKLADLGLVPRDFGGEAGAAARGSVDFGGLFIGLSLFLIAAALVFAALLFLFTLERRAAQAGLLLATGWTPRQVRRSLLGEAGVIAIVGAVLGVFGGEAYTRLALQGLSGVWSGAAQGLPLIYAGSVATQAGAGIGAVLVLLLVLAWSSRRMFGKPARELLSGQDPAAETAHAAVSGWRRFMPLVWLLGAIALLAGGAGAGSAEAVAGLFFGGGFLLLLAGLSLARQWLRKPRGLAVSLSQIGLRNLARRPSRSLAVMGMMAGGIFLVTAVNAFRLGAGDTLAKTSGTGGFSLVGESSLPIYEDLNTAAGRDAFGLDEELLEGVTIVPFRVRPGDDASCLNLNRAQKPVLAGVNPALLEGRFRFATGDWQLTGDQAVADQATALWGLGLGRGDTLEYQDGAGRSLRVELAGLLAGSVLQGKMIVSEAAFLKAYPDTAGYRFFLIESPADKAAEVAAHLTRQLEKRGLALEPARQRLETFLSVQNTYIGIFTVLGGLGVLLGTAGLGILVSRHVLERRGELGLMQAVGFLPAALRRLVLGEHVVLLTAGLLLGVASALLAVWPALCQGGGDLPFVFLGLLLATVFAFGVSICAVAVQFAIRGCLIDAIRRE
jgi:ABC-type lipoprotein release transport system permease subunit